MLTEDRLEKTNTDYVVKNDGSKQRAVNYMSETMNIRSFLDEDDIGRRLLFAMPESLGDIFLCTSLLRSVKEQYPDYNIYFACFPKYNSLVENNSYIHKVIPFFGVMDNFTWMEGANYAETIFDISFTPYFFTQRSPMYIHNGHSNIAHNMRYED
jgi:hypothetical protein|tara:strand:- start:936 stop:1400 length:465 start_codon:yes stop_codon:yes gene_type:complete